MAEDLTITIDSNGILDPNPAHVVRGQGVRFQNNADCIVVVDVPNALFGGHLDEVIGQGILSNPVYVSQTIHPGTFDFGVTGSCLPKQAGANPDGDGDGYGGGRTGKIIVED